MNAVVCMHGGSESEFVFIGFRRLLKHTATAFRMINVDCRYSLISQFAVNVAAGGTHPPDCYHRCSIIAIDVYFSFSYTQAYVELVSFIK